MPKGPRIQDVEFGGPATYRIVVQGVVNLDWADRLAGLKISTVSRGEHPAHSTLEGPIRDQDELNGVLETLCGLHLPIFKVEKTEARATEA